MESSSSDQLQTNSVAHSSFRNDRQPFNGLPSLPNTLIATPLMKGSNNRALETSHDKSKEDMILRKLCTLNRRLDNIEAKLDILLQQQNGSSLGSATQSKENVSHFQCLSTIDEYEEFKIRCKMDLFKEFMVIN